MSDLYTEQLEMQLRFAEEEAQKREMLAYEQGREDAIDEVINLIRESYNDAGTSECFEAWRNRLEQMKGERNNE